MKAIALLFAALLTGCASDPTRWENRVVCTVDGSEAHVISKWWGFSIGSQLAPADAGPVCRGGRKKEDNIAFKW